MAKDSINKITSRYQNVKNVCSRLKRGGICNIQNLNTVKNKSNNAIEKSVKDTNRQITEEHI